jgi:hypothetical protein
MAKCYILASLSNILQHQKQDMLSLEEMFGNQGGTTRQGTMMSFLSAKMVEGTSVRVEQ